jgi:hypothetical protein
MLILLFLRTMPWIAIAEVREELPSPKKATSKPAEEGAS